MTTLELSTLDYVFTADAFEPISFSLRYPRKLDAERIIEAFRLTASRFTAVSGVLLARDRNTLYFDLSHDAASVVVADGDPAVPWTDHVDVVQPGLGEPLARVRITRRGDETVLAFSLSHAVADGYGYFLFLASWAAQCRGQILFEPNCSRALLKPVGVTPSTGRAWQGDLPQSGLYLEESDNRPLKLAWRPESLTGFSVTANKALGLSSNDVISAAVWQKSVQGGASGPTTFCSVVDIRRFRAELGPTFFGNALLIASVTVDARELQTAAQEAVAGWIRTSLTSVPDRIDGALVELEALRLSEGVTVFRRIRSIRRSGMLVTNMSRTPYDALDFGDGPPIAVEPVLGTAPAPCAVVLPSTDGLRVLTARA